jgi:hypothetical protein
VAFTATAIADVQRARHDGDIANHTINMHVGVLPRVLKACGRWRALADQVKNLPERQRPIGRALTSEERRRLFDVAASEPGWEHVYCTATSPRARRCVEWRSSTCAGATHRYAAIDLETSGPRSRKPHLLTLTRLLRRGDHMRRFSNGSQRCDRHE